MLACCCALAASRPPIPSCVYAGPAHRCSAAAPAVEGAPSSESNNSSVIYSHPELYEAAFSYRDIKQEVGQRGLVL